MKLRSLKLHGFKSFADRTTIEFRDGVTAIVGSNGCGKSNTADGVRWVLGEQRASAMRGGKMEDVIFQGAAGRRPVNVTEVSLVFSNEDGAVAVPQSEIEVARKVFREGGSEYMLNRTPCRLRDVHDVLRDTGLGANAYSIIEAGMIDAILSERAEERRALFEEAAGIGKYKDRRRAAQRRLEQAEGDLARLNDLVAEVESKVRALARQRRKAQRHQELQARRLDLEVAVAREEMAGLAAALAHGAERLQALAREEADHGAEVPTAEAIVAERRIEAAELSRLRQGAAARLDDVRRRLDAREREIMLADERRTHAEMRIAQLVRERQELAERAARLGADAQRLEGDRARAEGRLEAMRQQLDDRMEANAALRATLAAHRQASDAAAGRARELAREIAQAEGERGALERRQHEAEQRIARLVEQEAQLAAEIAVLGEQTDLWTVQGDTLRLRRDAAAEAVEIAREETRMLRGREQAAQAALRTAEDGVSRLTAQVAAREALEASYEGFSPAVARVMQQHDRFPGVLAPLADFVRAAGVDPRAAASVESFLGTLLQGLVVEDLAAARAVRDWFRREWKGGGTLLLLPLDAPGVREGTAMLRASDTGVGGTGRGGAWVDAFLAGLLVLGGEDPLDGYPLTARVDSLGDTVDARGVVRLGQPATNEGILARREALAQLRTERDAATAARDRLAAARDELRDAVADAEERAREADELRRSAEGEIRRLEAETAAHGARSARLERERLDAVSAAESARRSAADAAAGTAAADARLLALRQAAET
ncbi:MAG TPA: AAA family ATPase, partial [Longimicrobiaceae bacterium]|nr:AAA family ATPase [Longimicrobiaceae bacterium]